MKKPKAPQKPVKPKRKRITYLYVVQGFESMKYNGDLKDVTSMRIVANSEQEALDKAKKMVTKRHYRIGEVQETRK